MKMYINEEEWYPVFTLAKNRGSVSLLAYAVEVDQNVAEEYKRIMDEFDALQDILSKLPTTKIEPTKTW